VTVLAQVLAGARTDPSLAAAARHALSLWIAEVEETLQRLLSASPIGEVANAAGLARAVAAAFVGIELYEGADSDGADAAFAALGQLASLTEVLDDLGPAARRALRHHARRAGAAGPPQADPSGSSG